MFEGMVISHSLLGVIHFKFIKTVITLQLQLCRYITKVLQLTPHFS